MKRILCLGTDEQPAPNPKSTTQFHSSVARNLDPRPQTPNGGRIKVNQGESRKKMNKASVCDNLPHPPENLARSSQVKVGQGRSRQTDDLNPLAKAGLPAIASACRAITSGRRLERRRVTFHVSRFTSRNPLSFNLLQPFSTLFFMPVHCFHLALAFSFSLCFSAPGKT